MESAFRVIVCWAWDAIGANKAANKNRISSLFLMVSIVMKYLLYRGLEGLKVGRLEGFRLEGLKVSGWKGLALPTFQPETF
jgi:hypothetical protein